MMPDYETLRFIWWLVLGVLLIGFAVTDGFDLGTGALLPFVARNDAERRKVINTVGPVWEGNQVWFILGGGAAFAAWPLLYAVSFSGFYLAMFMVLVALILRPVGFKFRSKLENPGWRSLWDWALFVGGAVPALVFGVAMGNVMQGVPFRLNSDLRVFYEGVFWELFTPFTLLCGVLSLCMMVMHGGAWLMVKTEGAIAERARLAAGWGAFLAAALFAAGGIVMRCCVNSYAVISQIDPAGPSNPLRKEVMVMHGGWFLNYGLHPWLLGVPLIAFAGLLLAYVSAFRGRAKSALVAGGLGIAGIIGTVGVSLFPFILPSSINPSMSLTVWDASSSRLTLLIMTVAAVVFLPIVLAYTAWVYRVLRGKVTDETVNSNPQAY